MTIVTPIPLPSLFWHAKEARDAIDLDGLLWNDLPEELVEQILSRLDLPCFCRFRSVCKRWNKLTSCKRFLKQCSWFLNQKPWFLVLKGRECYSFDGSNSWSRICLDFLPKKPLLSCSAGGLLCCLNCGPAETNLHLCNPLSRSCTQLPPMLKNRWSPAIGLCVDSAKKSYKVVVAGDDWDRTTEVYDSCTKKWEITSIIPVDNPSETRIAAGQATISKGVMYCTTQSAHGIPHEILAYEIAESTWSKITAPMGRNLRFPAIIERHGSIFMVGAVVKSRAVESIKIWALSEPDLDWIEAESMPKDVMNRLIGSSSLTGSNPAFKCSGQGDLIMFTSDRCPDILLFDCFTKNWIWASGCPFFLGTEAVEALPFHPSLEAMV